MADLPPEIGVTFEALAALERDFEDVEAETLRLQHTLGKPLYKKREELVSKIPNFWPLVLEQAPPDLDQYIQPNDSNVLLLSLTSVSVSHFEIEDGGKGDPRSISIKLEFAGNDYFEDKVLEKKFWHRRSRSGYSGLVSEPVPIKWKPEKDLTHGLVDLAVKVWEEDKKQGRVNGEGNDKKKVKSADWTNDQKALRQKIDAYGLGGVSFFCWFGYRGHYVSAEENAIAVEEDKKKRADRAEGKAPETKEAEEDEDEDDDEDDEEDPFALEIFPDGDNLAIAFAEDIWPNAIKYFVQAQEADAMSDADFEEDDGDDMEEMIEDDDDDDDEAPPLKRVKA
ncbi:nucleosome assembly protein [Nemania sp. FL0916]|nr:nucleosome assembly protein [Nemania sp. FL0916]